jgi:hypothetical protein
MIDSTKVKGEHRKLLKVHEKPGEFKDIYCIAIRHSVGALACVMVSEATEKARIAYRCSVTPLKKSKKTWKEEAIKCLNAR